MALRDFLKQELGMVESLLDLNENEAKTVVQAPVPVTKNSLSDARIAGIKHQLGMR